MKIGHLLAGVALAVLIGPAVAAAATIDLSINAAPYSFASFDTSGNPIAGNVVDAGADQVTNNDTAFWTATDTFNLSSVNGASLAIADLFADDRVVVELNGNIVAAAGLFAPGEGTFIFTPTGAQVPQSFLGNGLQTISAGGLVVGANTIELIVNNTNNGINGGLTQGPSSLGFTGVVTTAGVPEPATWAMMMIGFGGLGMAMRSRRKLAAVTI
jgi:PEP-CTERM motif